MPTQVDVREGIAMAPRGSLNMRTLALLRDRPRHWTYVKISEELKKSNCRAVSVHWLHQYCGGRIENPDVDRVQAIYELLSGNMLDID